MTSESGVIRKLVTVYRAYRTSNPSENIGCTILNGCYLKEEDARASVAHGGCQGDPGRVESREEVCLVDLVSGKVWIIGEEVK